MLNKCKLFLTVLLVIGISQTLLAQSLPQSTTLPTSAWHVPLLGNIVHSYFASTSDLDLDLNSKSNSNSSVNELLILASDRQALSVIHTSTSELKWRYFFPKNENYISSIVCSETLISISNSSLFGVSLKLWSLNTGHLISLLQVPDTIPSLESPSLFCFSKEKIGLLVSHRIYQVIPSLSPPSLTLWYESSFPISNVKCIQGHFWALSQFKPHSFTLLHSNSDTLPPKPIMNDFYTTSQSILFKDLVVLQNQPTYFVVQFATKVLVVPISKDLKVHPSTSFIELNLPSLLSKSNPSDKSPLYQVSLLSHYLLISTRPRSSSAPLSFIYDLSHSLLEPMYQGEWVLKMDVDASSSLYVLLPNHVQFYPKKIDSLSTNTTKTTMTTLSAPSAFVKYSMLDRSLKLHYHLFSVSKRTNLLFTSTVQGHIQLWNQHQVRWTRYESLASPQVTFLFDFPTSPMWEEQDHEQESTPFFIQLVHRWSNRWKSHFDQLVQFKLLNPSFTHHHFNCAKLIFIWSKNQCVYALDSRHQGKILWWKPLPNAIDSIQMYQPTKGSEPGLLLLKSKTNPTMLLNPFSGEFVNLPKEPSLSSVQSNTLISNKYPSFITPTTPSSSFVNGTFVYQFNHLNHTLNGFFKPSHSTPSSSLLPIYSLAFPLPIVKKAQLDRTQRIASQGRILVSNRSVQYKYLNPHQLAILTGLHSTYELYFVDTVAGHVLFTYHLEQVRSEFPIHLITVEHWTLMVYLHEEHGWIATVFDFYEPLPPSSVSFFPFSTRSFSSFTSLSPKVHVASFALPIRLNITSVAVTCTRNNIAIRDLVFTTDEFIGSISRKWLDGLRSSTLTPTTTTSGSNSMDHDVPSYDPVLPMTDLNVVSKGMQVKTNQLLTSPTELESTSILVALQPDLFYTTWTPSGSFDRLSSQFPKLGLIATCLALAVSAFVARAMLRRKQLQVQWY